MMRKTLPTLTQIAALLALVNSAGADQLLGNLDQPVSLYSWVPGPDTALIQRFISGSEAVHLQSLTLEQWTYGPNYPLVVELYRESDQKFLGAFPNFAADPAPTAPPGLTTYIDYSPDGPIDLAPNTGYVLVVSGLGDPANTGELTLTDSPLFSAAPGWSLGAASYGWYPYFEIGRQDHLKVQLSGTPFIPNNPPPDITGAHASLSALWPPNGKMIPLTIVGITDPDPNSITVTITGIQQNEPVANRPGDTSPDSLIGANGSFALKAERLSDGGGRIYAVSFLAGNGKSEAEAGGTVYVTVPVNMEQLEASGFVRPSKGASGSKKH